MQNTTNDQYNNVEMKSYLIGKIPTQNDENVEWNLIGYQNVEYNGKIPMQD